MPRSDDLSPAGLQALLGAASKQVGLTPEQLQQAAQNGRLDQVLQGASPQLRRALTDPEAARQVLATPQAQKLLQLLQKGSS